MNGSENKHDEGDSCGQDGRPCCGGANKWIWIILAVALVGVLVARNTKKTPAAGDSLTTAEAPVVPAIPEPAIQKKALPRLLDLGADKCVPCKMMAPILVDLKSSCAGIVDVEFIDVWENPAAGETYGIKMIPTQIFFDADGKELFRHEGFFGKEDILAKWKELGVETGAEGTATSL